MAEKDIPMPKFYPLPKERSHTLGGSLVNRPIEDDDDDTDVSMSEVLRQKFIALLEQKGDKKDSYTLGDGLTGHMPVAGSPEEDSTEDSEDHPIIEE